MRIALVHDYLVQNGGAEKVLKCFCEIFPHAPIYTLVYDKEVMDPFFRERRIYTSWLQKLSLAQKRHRLFPPLMPSAIEQFDLSQYDVVLSSSHSYAKGVLTRPETLHISYIHTPMRYAWDDCQRYTQEFYFPRMIKKFIPFAMNSIRVWDHVSAQRPDHIIANSAFIARRIKKYYQRDVDAIMHPPIETHRFAPAAQQADYFLMVGRLMSNKRFDIAIDAFNILGLPLKIIGRGPELKRLKQRAKGNIEFLERVSDEELPEYYAKCKAFLFPQEEDFGIVAQEAFASGRPVIAFRGGDIVEHLTEGQKGLLFDEQTPEALIDAITRFRVENFDSAVIRQNALSFDRSVFKRKMEEYVELTYDRRLITNDRKM